MNNEPVAWMHKEATGWLSCTNQHPETEIDEWLPLYNHPAKEHDLGISHAIGFDDGFKAGMQRAVEMNLAKTLTDEEWSDKTDQWADEIEAAHPLNTNDYKTYELACEMVHNRHSKYALVGLVNWLLRKAQEK